MTAQRGSRLLIGFFAAFVISACGIFRHIDVESVATSVDKPSNVAVYLSVNEGNEPLTELTEQSFAIFENEQPVSPEESKLVLLDRDLPAYHRTLLLVDMSAAKDDGTRQQLSRAVAGFVGFVRKDQPVTIYAFDGSADIKLIGDYEKGESGPQSIAEIANFKNADPSRNLHGAVIAGLKELGARLMTKQKPIRVGTLVVLTAGPDLAGRATIDQTQQAIQSSGYQIVAVGVGEKDAYNLLPIGKNGVMWAPSLGATGPVLDDTASHVQSLHERHYLVSYCSPARAGTRKLRIEVNHTSSDGQEHHGSVNVEFDATGFGPGCDPSKPPSFGMSNYDVEAKTKASDKSQPENSRSKPPESGETAPAPNPPGDQPAK